MRSQKKKCAKKVKALQRLEGKKHMAEVLEYLKKLREKLEKPELQQAG